MKQMDMLSAEQMAKKWKVSTRTVQNLCRKGRIPGAILFGKNWMIPDDAKRPKDGRYKEKTDVVEPALRIEMPVKSPLMIMSSFYQKPGDGEMCVQSLSATPEIQALFAGQLAFMQGDVPKSLEWILPLLDQEMDFYGTLNIGMVVMAVSVWLNDTELWKKGRERMVSAPCQDEGERKLQKLWLAISDTAIPTKPQEPAAFSWTEFDQIPKESMPLYLFYYAKHIHRLGIEVARGESCMPDVQGMGVLRMFPYLVEPLIAQAHSAGALLPEIYLHLLCADAYNKTGEGGKSEQHLDMAVSLCLPDKLYGILAEYRGLMSNALDQCLERRDKDAAKTIQRLEKQMYANWMKMICEHEDFGLSDRQKEVARLISVGLSNDEIAARLGISHNTVKSNIMQIMNKTGTTKRTEFEGLIF